MQSILSAFSLCVVGVAAVCNLGLQSPNPLVVKSFGSKTAIVRKQLNSIELADNETLTFHCPTGFNLDLTNNEYIDYEYRHHFTVYHKTPAEYHKTTAAMICESGILNIYDKEDIIHHHIHSISCNGDYSQTLYESNISLSGCGDEAMTLVIGYRLSPLGDVKLLGLCYDLYNSRPKFASYLAYAPTNVLFETQWSNELQSLQLDTYLGSFSQYFKYVSEGDFQRIVAKQKRLGELFDPKLFEYSSLVQEEAFATELSGYQDMLKVVWLKTLRSGNWRHFLNALRDTTKYHKNDKEEKYDIRVGVSGVAALPLASNCNATIALNLETDKDGGGSSSSLPVPAHIWAHLRSLQPVEGNGSEEFVVVAHNSPYATLPELGSLCPDMCAEIPWLRDSLFGQLHLVPMYGVVSCCRVDQLAAKLVDFFPQQSLTKPSAQADPALPLPYVKPQVSDKVE